MTEKTIYIANDGTEFNDEFECRKHEISGNFIGVILLDGDRNEISFLDEDSFDSIEYLYIPSKESAKELYNFYGMPFNKEALRECYWDEDSDEYRSIDSKIKELEARIKDLCDIKNELRSIRLSKDFKENDIW